MEVTARQMLTILRSASFNNALVADRLRSIDGFCPEAKLELVALARQLDEDADELEAVVRRSNYAQLG